MERTKRRTLGHVRGERGIEIVRGKLPRHWVVRELHPDYGLDLHIEVFEPPTQDAFHADTLGEHFFAQVKTVEATSTIRMEVRNRPNVAKFRLSGTSAASETTETLDVISFSLDTPELRTVEAMGASLPVLLLLVDEKAERVYYVCLNDYVSKVLLPEQATYAHQDSWTIHVPAFNLLDAGGPEFSYVRLLARRSKLYGAFATFTYQFHELRMALPTEAEGLPATIAAFRDTRLSEMLDVFVTADLRLGIWGRAGVGFWSPLGDVHAALERVARTLRGDEVITPDDFLSLAMRSFSMAAGLGRMYEELCREWRLPTALGAAVLAAEHAELEAARRE
jgi:hypothetical protein